MKKDKDWFKERGYPHFSNKISKKQRSLIESYLKNPEKIASHSFLPLIFKQIKQRRYKISDFNGKLRRSHKKLKGGKIVSNSKIREILYSTHVDAHIYSYYTQKIISPKYENYLRHNDLLSSSISAYRRLKTEDGLKFKNNVHFAKDVFCEIKRRESCVSLVVDIENFFPSLDHKKLKLAWAKILGFKSLPKDHYNLYKSITKFSYIKLEDLKTYKGHYDEKKLALIRKEGKNTFFNNVKELIDSDIIIHKNQKTNKNKKLIGIPQGLPISALLANIYMLSFDEAIIEKLTIENNIFYRRYSDDIVFICDEKQISLIENTLKTEIEKINLKVSKEKTEKTLFKYIDDKLWSYRIKESSLIKNIPLNYLGFEFYGHKTLLKSKNLAQFYREMKNTISRKNKRIEVIKDKYLVDNAPIFKRKIYRQYSYLGVKTRMIPFSKTEYQKGKKINFKGFKKFRGNYIKYAYMASEELDAPEIKRQVRNHWKILQKTIKKYNFSNIK